MAVPLRSEASWSSWRRKWKPDLKSQPWKNFKISGITHIIKSHFTEADCSYEFCISDLKTVWYEKIDEKTFRNRSKVNLPLPNSDIYLKSLVCDTDKPKR